MQNVFCRCLIVHQDCIGTNMWDIQRQNSTLRSRSLTKGEVKSAKRRVACAGSASRDLDKSMAGRRLTEITR
jgi:hypothetical protein